MNQTLRNKKVGMVSLGCPKNQVDAEQMLYRLKEGGYTIETVSGESDIVIVNTCGFIESAKAEAIENLLELITLKKEGTIKKIIVTGCLAERYRDEITKEMPEIDAVVSLGRNEDILSIVDKVASDKKVRAYGEKEDLPLEGGRLIMNLPFFAYLKIAEGCDNRCSYCAIPFIRGRFRSRPMENIIKEAEYLAENGVKELILVAQDTTKYGYDLYGEYRLAALLKALCKIDGFRWIRVLYAYPDKITDELLEVMASEEKVVKYLDLPLQHCNGEILKQMHRPGDEASLTALIEKIRDKIPGITLRTTLIAGFPGETEAQFEALCDFVKKTEFDRLGCFSYSAEEGTEAEQMENQIPEEEKNRRSELIMTEQTTVMIRKNEAKIGQKVLAVVEGFDRYGECYFGRTEADAPDIDGKIFFTSAKKHQIGDFVTVLIEETLDLDLVGSAVE